MWFFHTFICYVKHIYLKFANCNCLLNKKVLAADVYESTIWESCYKTLEPNACFTLSCSVSRQFPCWIKRNRLIQDILVLLGSSLGTGRKINLVYAPAPALFKEVESQYKKVSDPDPSQTLNLCMYIYIYIYIC